MNSVDKQVSLQKKSANFIRKRKKSTYFKKRENNFGNGEIKKMPSEEKRGELIRETHEKLIYTVIDYVYTN